MLSTIKKHLNDMILYMILNDIISGYMNFKYYQYFLFIQAFMKVFRPFMYVSNYFV